jgi:hypothetical protein
MIMSVTIYQAIREQAAQDGWTAESTFTSAIETSHGDSVTEVVRTKTRPG